MTDRRSLSEIPQGSLRDHGVDARVDRVWQRLEKSAQVTASRPRRLEARRGALALAAVTFGLGVLVGARFAAPSRSAAEASLAAEPSRGVVAQEESEAAAAAVTAAARPGAGPQSARAPRRAAGLPRPLPTLTVEAPPSPAPEPAPPAPVTAEWPRLADEGQYEAALESLEGSGGFDAALEGANAEQLMSLVDIARATGQRERAVRGLRRIVDAFSGDPSAPVAAWMLANELARSRDLAGAERAFATYRALSPGGDFAEDALARQIDMAAEQGSLERAKRLAGQYLKEFPDGPRSADIQSQLDRWSRAADPAAPTAVGDAGAPP